LPVEPEGETGNDLLERRTGTQGNLGKGKQEGRAKSLTNKSEMFSSGQHKRRTGL